MILNFFSCQLKENVKVKYLKLLGIGIFGLLFLYICIKFKFFSRKYVYLNDNWQYASFSKIYSDPAFLYRSNMFKRKNIVVAVNAGHGTSGGQKVMTYCHPDKSAKVTGGTTSIGSIQSYSISDGTSFSNGITEAEVNLKVANYLKERLLTNGYDVLMLRISDDTKLDNIARTIIANNVADVHISIHFDASSLDNGAFYISVPDLNEYREMYPVSEHWRNHEKLGECLIKGLKIKDAKVAAFNSIPLDLTQTSFSTIPSVDIELGDLKSDISEKALKKYANGLYEGIEIYFEK